MRLGHTQVNGAPWKERNRRNKRELPKEEKKTPSKVKKKKKPKKNLKQTAPSRPTNFPSLLKCDQRTYHKVGVMCTILCNIWEIWMKQGWRYFGEDTTEGKKNKQTSKQNYCCKGLNELIQYGTKFHSFQ